MSQTVHRYGRIGYLLHVPATNPDDTRRKFPLILFLHGSGERGDDPNQLKNYGLPKVIEDQPDFPFIVVSPQCPTNQWWMYDAELVMALLDYTIAHELADERRIYLTGASMGGFGTWQLATLYPDRFAAIAPVCAVALQPLKQIQVIKELPVWAFHGKNDVTVPAEQTEIMIAALRAYGGDPQATYVEDAGHELGTTAYENRELFRWFMKNHRSPA